MDYKVGDDIVYPILNLSDKVPGGIEMSTGDFVQFSKITFLLAVFDFSYFHHLKNKTKKVFREIPYNFDTPRKFYIPRLDACHPSRLHLYLEP